jgi:hypothetical protein
LLHQPRIQPVVQAAGEGVRAVHNAARPRVARVLVRLPGTRRVLLTGGPDVLQAVEIDTP